jgi:hypothetical protein
MTEEEIIKKFLFCGPGIKIVPGTFVVKSFRTGKYYCVEYLGDPHIKWGDLNPATGKIEGDYGSKSRYAVEERDSQITTEKGFINIKTLEPGQSPMEYINELDAKYPDKVI